MSKAAIAAGADGLLIEVHPEPDRAWVDGQQTLTLEEFARLMKELRPVARAVGREL
jgi:3-deoxy-7-phosphoheptulonate synthase